MKNVIIKRGEKGSTIMNSKKQIGYSVAAIVPNYNYEDFIIERIDSILSQSYPVSELIILDDASSDGSVKVIKNKISEIKKDYSNIKVKLIVNEENSGGCVFAQWQKGLREVNSDYFWIAEADDVADRHFLEVAMKKFKKYPTAVLFYCDSYRINQYGKIISKTCSDWADMWGQGRWRKDFFNKGEDEIINYLSGTNPILNVSSVVWKNTKGLLEIFDEAKQFRVAGDWYIYTRVLEEGDIVYSAKRLNRYRKHDKGSASTVVKLSREYKEVVSVQERVSNKYDLNDELLEWQKVRRRGMGMVEKEDERKNIRGRIAWFVPDFNKGSGGHRTIFQNANMLINRGYACDLYIETSPPRMPIEIHNKIEEWYGGFKGDVFNDFNLAKDYDIVIATGWNTVEAVAKTDCKNKLYFVQDYEPWFFPMGQEYLEADMSYRYGLKGISIGRWLPVKLKKKYNLDVLPFSFGADLDIYHRLDDVKQENAVCFIFQPGKPRRCSDLGLKALRYVQAVKPETKIYLYGSEKEVIVGKNIKHLGMLTPEKCNELYNKCKVGLCFSASNPSRIPFEMMAAGLPVVDFYLENNLYDFPEDGCLLAKPDPKAVAEAILEILDDEKLRKKMSLAGEKYMKKYPLSRGYDEFGNIIDDLMSGKKVKRKEIDKMYKREAIGPMECDVRLGPEYKFKTPDEIWRENLTIPQRIYLKIRYILIGR